MARRRQKSVLIIAYAFPPNSAVGSMRPLRFCRYLCQETDWEPVVLSVDRPGIREDGSLLATLPDRVRVVRTRTWEPYYQLHPIVPSPGAGRSRAVRQGSGPTVGENATTSPEPGRFRRLLRTARYWLEEPLMTPDPQVFWNLFMVPRACGLVRRQKIDAVLVTAPPFSALFGAALTALLTGRPLIADFRDPWTDIVRGSPSPWRRRGERLLERWLCRTAAAVVSSSETYSQDFRDKYPDLPAGRFTTVHNGFDEEALARMPDAQPSPHGLTIVHLGSLYQKREPVAFFVGAGRWLADDPARRDGFRLVFVGQVDARTRALLAANGLGDVTEVTGQLAHAEAIARCREADLLLLAMGSGPATPLGWLPSKLYEYLACNRPILAHTVEGEAARLIRRAGAGDPVTADDPAAFVARLTAYREAKLALGRAPAHANHPGVVRELTQACLVRKLAAILDGVRT